MVHDMAGERESLTCTSTIHAHIHGIRQDAQLHVQCTCIWLIKCALH